MISQQLLRAENARRIGAVRPELAARLDLSSEAGLLAARAQVAAAGAKPLTTAVCVLRSFELAAWLGETYAFVRGVGAEAATAWRQDFTRTVFLAGDPARLRERFAFTHVAQDGASAWLGPAPAERSTTLRRLLKLFPGTVAPRPVPGTVVDLPADGADGRPPVRHELHLATAGLTISQTLVHLHHLLSDAVLDGFLGPGDRLVLRPVPRLVGVQGPFEALRIDAAPDLPHRLHAHAALTACP